MARLKKVLIVGGGTAGWLAACYLAKAVNAVDPNGVQVHLVESPDIGLLGVGEATFPSIRGTLAAIGLDGAAGFAAHGLNDVAESLLHVGGLPTFMIGPLPVKAQYRDSPFVLDPGINLAE